MKKLEGYSRYLTWVALLLLGILVAGCGNNEQSPILGGNAFGVRAPSVIAVAPANNATAVPLNTSVTAEFNEPVSPLVSGASFILTCAAPCASPSGSVVLDASGRTATFVAGGALAPFTLYTATVTGARSVASKLPMESPYTWSFTTGAAPDLTKPQIVLTIPATQTPGPTPNIAINTAISAVFTEDMAPATITASSFTVTCAAPCVSPAGAVSYVLASRTAVFTPAAVLASATTYTVTITTVATDLAGNALAGNQAALPAASNYSWTFTTGVAPDTTKPRVTLTSPVTSIPGPTTAVPTNTAIAAVFSKELAPATVSGASFTVTCAAPCVSPAGAVSYVVGSHTAVFTPAIVLAAGTTYTATIKTAVTDVAGNALAGNQAALPAASDYIWTFTTAVPPVIVRPAVSTTAPVTTTPGPTTNVPTNTAIAAIFTKDMAPATISGSSFTLSCVAPCTAPAGVVSYVVGSKTAVFTPAALLANATTYTATITTAATDLAGDALGGNQAALPASSNYVWTFTTAAAPPPIVRPAVTLTVPVTTSPGQTGVATNTAITAIFSKAMAPATINAASFTLTCAAPCVSPAGLVSYIPASNTAVFTPAAALTGATVYTATITTAATDLAGDALGGNQGVLPAASNYVWTFTTAIPPANISVLSTSPLTGATAVCPSTTINATFNVPSGLRLDPASVTNATFKLTGPAPALTPVTGSVVIDPATGHIATFAPLADLTVGVTYTATITGGVSGIKDLAIPANTMPANFTWSFTTGPKTGQCLQPIALGAAAPFGIYGGSAGMTNQGVLTVINGDIGTSAVSTGVTGFNDAGPGCIYTETPLNVGNVNGTIFTAAPPPTVACPTEGTAVTAAVAAAGRADALVAYNAMVAAPAGSDPGAGSLANLVLTPGVYTSASGTFKIQGGDLTLDAQGNTNAVWIFQMATSLTVGGPGAAFPQNVILVNGAQAKNVFWQVGSAATINAGGGGTMVGTIITQAGATFSTAGNVTLVTLNGRALSLGASVTVVNTVINVPGP